MEENNSIKQIDYPVTFNPIKHHLGFIIKQVKEWQKKDWPEIERELLLMGNNMLDLYYGKLSVTEISEECYKICQKEGIANLRQLSEWLHPEEYRKITLSDRSVWIIKKGSDNKHFIHIHPAKHSPFSVRARATTLKTVAVLKTQAAITDEDTVLNIKMVNNMRTSHLNLSPVKTLTKDKGIARLWTIINLIINNNNELCNGLKY